MLENYYAGLRTHPEPTFKFFYLGLVIIIAGIGFTFSANLIVGLLMILAGIFLLLSVKGVIIDPAANQLKIYYNFFFVKFGEWTPLSEFTHIVLGSNNSSKTLNHRFASTTVRTKSYSISLLNKKMETVELREFIEYHVAEHYLKSISNQIGLPTINKHEIMQKIAAEKRQYRR